VAAADLIGDDRRDSGQGTEGGAVIADRFGDDGLVGRGLGFLAGAPAEPLLSA